MRRLPVIVVAALILLAGCGGGGGGTASPTEELTDTPASETSTGDSMDSTATPTMADDGPESTEDDSPSSDDDSQSTEDDSPSTENDSVSADSSALSSASSEDLFEDATVVNGTWYNGTEETTAVIRNDTSNDRELTELTRPSGETGTVYTTDDYVAYRNGTTGDVQYGEPDGLVGTGVTFEAAFVAIGPLLYFNFIEWETSRTVVDGQEAVVYQGESLNETAFTDTQNFDLGFEQGDVQSVDGEIVISSDGQIYSATIEIETGEGTYGGDLSVSYDDSTVTQPDWVDESQAP
jgi:hypothetical protein